MTFAKALQLHPHCMMVLNHVAAGRPKESDWYRWIFENEPCGKSRLDGSNVACQVAVKNHSDFDDIS
jgi:hypothetical protein